MSFPLFDKLYGEPNLLIPGEKPVGEVEQDESHPLSYGLKARYVYNEGAGVTVNNAVGTQYPGTIIGDVSWVNSSRGTVLSFGGTNGNRVELTDGNDLAFEGSTESLTLMMWINTTTVTTHQALMYKADANDDFWRFHLWSDNKLAFSLNSTDAFSANGVITVGEWAHVAVSVVRTGNATFYVNGLPSGLPKDMSGIALNLAVTTIQIGEGQIVDFPFSGLMDDPRIYNRALSATEIAEIYFDTYQDIKPINSGIWLPEIAAVGGVTGKSNPLWGPLGGPLVGVLG